MQQARPALVEPRTEPRSDNPFGSAREVAPVGRTGGLVSVEQQRAVAEVQARMLIARANPRDPVRAMDLILNDCTRPTLAEAAVFQYSRGGTDIHGPTIRIAEAIAQRWGNIASGIKELSRHDGYSECVAYAWDLESGFYDERQFQIRHWRDTRQGGYALTDERDVYELIANFGQRRKRAVLLTVIPGDVVEAALSQCEKTMAANADTSADSIQRLVAAFDEFGVTQQQIERRIQRRLDAIRPAQIVMLRKIYNSLRDGMSEPADWFEPIGEAAPAEAAPTGQAAASTTSPPSGETPRRRGRPPGQARQREADTGTVGAPTPPEAPAAQPEPPAGRFVPPEQSQSGLPEFEV